MSSAAAAREARRKAILSRGNDRLSKLATTARGEDYVAAFTAKTEEPARSAPTTDAFLGEESVMSTPPARASPAPALIPPTAQDGGPSAWSPEQQQEFIRALMAAPDPPLSELRAPSQPDANLSADTGDDPMAAMLSALTQMTGQGAPPGLGNFSGMPAMPAMPGAATNSAPRSLFMKLRPLLHLLASWTLLAFFAFKMEPEAYAERSGMAATIYGTLERWAELAWRAPSAFAVQAVPFFWAFTTLQLVLHSAEILTKKNPVQPPALLAFALPHLPPQARSIITNVLSYVRMGGMLLDDIAGLVAGIGVLIWVAGLFAGAS